MSSSGRRAHPTIRILREPASQGQTRTQASVMGPRAVRDFSSSPGVRMRYTGGMSEVTRLLDDAAAGDRKAAADLLPLVYDELRKLAAARMADESPGHTLQPTALVHEAYLRL